MFDNSELNLLKNLQNKIQNKSTKNILSEELDYLVTCFVPNNPYNVRAQAYLILSSLCDLLNHSGHLRDETSIVWQKFRPALDRRLIEVEEKCLLELLSFHVALFVVDAQPACVVFQYEGYEDTILDSLDLFPDSLQLRRLLASLVAQACGHKTCREVVSTRLKSWLESDGVQAKDCMLRAALVLAQVKYTQGLASDASTVMDSHSEIDLKQKNGLFDSIVDIIIQANNIIEATDAIEAMVYLITSPSIKERVVSQSTFLKRLLSFRPVKTSESIFSYTAPTSTAMYGLCVIIENLTSYRWRLSEEEKQIEKLKAMTNSKVDKESHLDDDSYVTARARKLLDAGAVILLVSIAKVNDSRSTKVTVGKALLNFAEDSGNRGKILQQGGGKTLMTLIQDLCFSNRTEVKKHQDGTVHSQSDFFVIQALAKLAITASPIQVFGPNEEVAYDAIRPFSILLLHQSSTLLQQFEALMALTNLSSSSQAASTRIGKSEGLLARVELLLLEENIMMRRASMELLCNLIAGSDNIFERYSGESYSGNAQNGETAKSRLHIILALSDVEDVPTRLAASGALAMLSASPNAALLLFALQKERQRMLSILKQLIDAGIEGWQSSIGDVPSFGLMHRGVICLRNILLNISDDKVKKDFAFAVDKERLAESLLEAVKTIGSTNQTQVILGSIAEIIKLLLKCGIVIQMN